ncbi:putative small monomeric GTPase [Dioscorea sansibarensis]
MKNLVDWVSNQLMSKSLLSARSFNSYDEDLLCEEPNDQGVTNTTNEISTTAPATNDTQLTESSESELVVPEISNAEALQIKLLQFVQRIGQSPNNLIVAQTFYRLHLANLIQSAECGVQRKALTFDRIKAIAAWQEVTGRPDLLFSVKILVLGKTGVGKSATINSLFDEARTATNAFQRGTHEIQEIVGTIKGIKVTVIDTPGLSPFNGNPQRNRKILMAVKKFIRKSSPDIVLYCERLDFIHAGYSDYSLLKLITEVFGSSMWFNTILVMTHASSPPPEPDGHPMSYEGYVGRTKNIVQHFIHQAMSSEKLVNPVVYVENHQFCGTNAKGEKILPNGLAWRSQLLLLCVTSKILVDANSLLKFQDSFQLSQTGGPLLSLPHFLSSFLQRHPPSNSNGIEDDDFVNFLDQEDEDDYDQLPPIRILSKAQFNKLSKAQKDAYLEELNYREDLYLRKQWKAMARQHKETVLRKNNDALPKTDHDHDDNDASLLEAYEIEDTTVPLSFDSDSPVHRYRFCVIGTEQWVIKPVCDSQGWDHDIGYDGIYWDGSVDIKSNLQATFAGQMNKEKSDFRINSECAAKFKHPNGATMLAGIDIQPFGKDLLCTVRGDAEFKNFCCNKTGGSLAVSSLGKTYFTRAKLEDSISMGKRLKVRMDAGCARGYGQMAHGGTLEATIRGKDYPVKDDKVTIATTLLSYDNETVIGGSVQSDFQIWRGTKHCLNASINSKGPMQISFKTSTSKHVQIALLALVTLFQGLFMRRLR